MRRRSTFVALLGVSLLLLTGWLAVRAGWIAADPNEERDWVRAAWQWVERFGWLVGIAGVTAALFSRPPAELSGVDPVSGDASAGTASITVPHVDDRVRGRRELANHLEALFTWRGRRSPRVWVLHGLGGSGKTTVAALAASRLRGRGVTVWWVSAATGSDLHAGLREVAVRTGATAAELAVAWSGQRSAVDLLWRLLDSYGRRWLLVIDNADDPRILASRAGLVSDGQGWLRPVATRRGAIVVTSREGGQVWGDWCHRQAVDMLHGRDGGSVLLDHAGPHAGNAEQAAALAERLGGLPLALRLVGNHLRVAASHPVVGTATTFEQYRSMLETDNVAEMLGSQVPSTFVDATARHVVGATWELSLRLLDDRGFRHARQLLRLLATFADAAIPTGLLLDADLIASSSPLRSLTAHELVGTLGALADHGLLDRSELLNQRDGAAPPTAVVRLHPLVRDTSRAPLRSAERPTYLELAARLLHRAAHSTVTGKPHDPLHWPSWQVLTPHTFGVRDDVSAMAAPPSDTVEPICDAASRCALFLHSAGRYGPMSLS